jgi:hypothetical protein
MPFPPLASQHVPQEAPPEHKIRSLGGIQRLSVSSFPYSTRIRLTRSTVS